MTQPKKWLPRINISQDEYGGLHAVTREGFSRDIFDYKKQEGRFEYISLAEAEHLADHRAREARAEAFGEAAKILWDEAGGDIGFAKGILEELSVPSSLASIVRLRKTVEQQLKRAESAGSTICPHGGEPMFCGICRT